jgi:ABC-type Fe3+ transport system permease subunit
MDARCGAEPPLLMIKLDAFYGKKVEAPLRNAYKAPHGRNISAHIYSFTLSAAAGMETFILKLLDVYGVAKVRWNGARTPESVA